MEMIKEWKIFRYKSSGKLIAIDPSAGYAYPLNSDYSFSSQKPHRVRYRTTPIEDTEYRMEIEEIKRPNGPTGLRCIRIYGANRTVSKSADPNAPLEERINISPSRAYTQLEIKYIGVDTGHWSGYFLFTVGIISIIFIGLIGVWPPLEMIVGGLIVIFATRDPGNPVRKAEIASAKERIRERNRTAFEQAISDLAAWEHLDGIGFEKAVAYIFLEDGYVVEYTPRTGDRGVDLILRRNGRVTLVQCKAYKKPVGVNAVREMQGARGQWPDAQDAMLVSIHGFTKQARDFAHQWNIKLYSIAKDHFRI